MKNIAIAIFILILLMVGVNLLRTSIEEPTEKTLIVGPVTKQCTGVTPQRCLQIKETPESTWQNYYGDIQGYTHEIGYETTISVIEKEIENPPADGSSLTYSLNKVLDQKAVPYIYISSPTDFESVPADTLVVKGTGRGLFENNVIVQIGSEIDMIASEPTIMQTQEMGGEGTWEVTLDISGQIPAEITGKISAFSPSPKEGDEGYRYTIPVTYVPASK